MIALLIITLAVSNLICEIITGGTHDELTRYNLD